MLAEPCDVSLVSVCRAQSVIDISRHVVIAVADM